MLGTIVLRKYCDISVCMTFGLHDRLKLMNSRFFAQIYRIAH